MSLFNTTRLHLRYLVPTPAQVASTISLDSHGSVPSTSHDAAGLKIDRVMELLVEGFLHLRIYHCTI
jgi:hypothetical protein